MKLNRLFALCLGAMATVCHAEELPTPYLEEIFCVVGEADVKPITAKITVPRPDGFAAVVHADLEDNPELRNARGEIVPANVLIDSEIGLPDVTVTVRFDFPQSNSVTFTGTLLLDLCKAPVEHSTELLPVEKLPQQVQLMGVDIKLRRAAASEEYIGKEADAEALEITIPSGSGVGDSFRVEGADGSELLLLYSEMHRSESRLVFRLPKKEKSVRFCCKQYAVTHSIKVPIRLRFGICGELAPRSE